MYTLDDIKEILDAEDSNTIDGYNVVRTNIMLRAAEAINELDAANAQLASMTAENERLKAANMTLYSRIESQIMNKDEGKDDDSGAGADDDEEKTMEEELEDNINAYKDI